MPVQSWIERFCSGTDRAFAAGWFVLVPLWGISIGMMGMPDVVGPERIVKWWYFVVSIVLIGIALTVRRTTIRYAYKLNGKERPNDEEKLDFVSNLLTNLFLWAAIAALPALLFYAYKHYT